VRNEKKERGRRIWKKGGRKSGLSTVSGFADDPRASANSKKRGFGQEPFGEATGGKSSPLKRGEASSNSTEERIKKKISTKKRDLNQEKKTLPGGGEANTRK